MTSFLLLAVSAFLSVNGTLEENGWKMGRQQAQDNFSVKDGVLTCVCSPNPMKGVSYHCPIDFPAVGEFSFDVKLFVSGHTERYVLQVCLGTFMMSFAKQSVMRQYPVEGLKYPNWTVVGKDRIPGNTWTKVRIRWNTPKRTIKYYVGEDQVVPSYVEEDVVISSGKGADGYHLSVGNYGLHADHEVHQLRNFEIRAVDEAAERASVVRDTAIVFRGLCSEYFPLEKWTSGFAPDRIVEFNLEYNGYNYTCENWLSLSGFPDDDLCRRAKLILLVDMPLEKRVLAYKVQEMLLEAVRDGALMLVTGGLAGLQRCGDFDAPIAKALPVSLVSPFEPPAGGARSVRAYGKGKISVLNQMKVTDK